MKIPQKIKIGGKTVEVIIDNLREKCGTGDLGMSQIACQKIWISNEAKIETQEEIFLHEIIEYIKFETDLEISHHQTLQTLANYLYQVLKDNQLLR